MGIDFLEMRSSCSYLQVLELLWLHLNPGKPSHLETAKVEVETKGLYDHSWSTTKDTPTDRAIPPAIDHPGAGTWYKVRPKMSVKIFFLKYMHKRWKLVVYISVYLAWWQDCM